MNMEIIGPMLLSIFAGFSTMIGLIPIFFKINKVGELISFALSFSYFILLSISIFDLLPSSIPILIDNYGLTAGLLYSILSFLIGYFIIYFIKIKEHESSLYRIGIISMISIILHNIPEGIIVFMTSYKNVKIGLKAFFAIMLHNIPEGLLISVPLYYSNKNRVSTIKKVFLASISEPLGALLSYIILGRVISNLLLSYILIFTSGIMISLCINDIFKELLKYNNKKYILCGFFISMIFIIVFLKI